MSENLAMWEALCRPPESALKRIAGGRLRGMTDINPQWRLQMMTEQFGPIGVGWYYEYFDRWTEPGGNDELMCFVSINLYVKQNGEWSKPIFGLGGSVLVANEKGGLHSNDEGYKMALTDALSVAMKELGVAADIYKGLWDGSKYIDLKPEDPEEESQQQAVASWQQIAGTACTSVAAAKEWWEASKCDIKAECGEAGASEVYKTFAVYYERLKAEAANASD